jgi:hypothetical protein
VEWQIGHERHVLDAGGALSPDSCLPHRARALDDGAIALIVLLPRREMLSAGSAAPASKQASRPDGDGAAA